MKQSEPVILSAVNHPDITQVCRTVHITAHCDKCGAVVTEGLHAPEVTWGFYCGQCCPCRTYTPSEAERRAIEDNRARMVAIQQRGRHPKQKGSARRVVNQARRQAALRQWADPRARRKIVAGIRRGHVRVRRSRD